MRRGDVQQNGNQKKILRMLQKLTENEDSSPEKASNSVVAPTRPSEAINIQVGMVKR